MCATQPISHSPHNPSKMPGPNANIPLAESSLREFCDRANSLTNAGLHEDFVRFCLTCRFPEGRNNIGAPTAETRYSLDAERDLEQPHIHNTSIRRDFDSVLGISKSLPYKVTVAVFAVPNFADTLQDNVHLSVKIIGSDGVVSTFHNDELRPSHSARRTQSRGTTAQTEPLP